jgi:hypothetical protein
MCYSPEVSAGTFLFAAVICSILWIRGRATDKAIAISLFFISLMQVVEFFLWFHTDCSPANKAISQIIPVLLFFQPVVVLASVLSFNAGWLPSWIYQGALLLWLLSIPLFLYWMRRPPPGCTTVGPTGHLAWPYANSTEPTDQFAQFLYNAALVLGLGTLRAHSFSAFYIALATASYFYTRQIYGHSWGSVWCNFVNFLAVGALIM